MISFLSTSDIPLLVRTQQDFEGVLSFCSFVSLETREPYIVQIDAALTAQITIEHCSVRKCLMGTISAFSVFQLSLTSDATINFSNFTKESISDPPALIIASTDPLTIIAKSSFTEIESLLPLDLSFLTLGSIPTSFVSQLYPIGALVMIADDAADNLSCLRDHLCHSLQFGLQCVASKQPSSSDPDCSTQFLVQTVSETLDQIFVIGSNVTIEPIRERINIKLIRSSFNSIYFFAVTAQFNVLDTSFVLAEIKYLYTYIWYLAPQSTLVIERTSFTVEPGINHNFPLILPKQAKVDISDFEVFGTTYRAMTFLQSTDSEVMLTKIGHETPFVRPSFSLPFIRLINSSTAVVNDSLFSHIHTESRSSFIDVVANDASITLSYITLIDSIFHESTFISVAGHNSSAKLDAILLVNALGESKCSCLLDLNLRNSSLDLGYVSQSLTMRANNATGLLMTIDATTAMKLQLDIFPGPFERNPSSEVMVMGDLPLLTLENIGGCIRSAGVRADSVVWKKTEESPIVSLISLIIMKTTTGLVGDEGTDNLACGSSMLPCRTLDYFCSFMKEEEEEVKITLAGSVTILSDVSLPQTTLVMERWSNGTKHPVLLVGSKEIPFSSLTFHSALIKDVDFVFDSNSAFLNRPFLKTESETSIQVSTLEFLNCESSFPVFMSIHSSVSLESITVKVQAMTIPTLAKGLFPMINMDIFNLSADSIAHPLFVSDTPSTELTCFAYFNVEYIGFCSVPLIEMKQETPAKFRFARCRFNDIAMLEDTPLISFDLRDSYVEMVWCDFDEIDVQTALSDPSSLSPAVLSLVGPNSLFLLSECRFMYCLSSTEAHSVVLITHSDNGQIYLFGMEMVECGGRSPLVISADSSSKLFPSLQMRLCSFESLSEPLLVTDGVESWLLVVYKSFQRGRVFMLVTFPIVGFVLLYLLLSFPFFVVSRRLSTHPAKWDWLKVDGGRGNLAEYDQTVFPHQNVTGFSHTIVLFPSSPPLAPPPQPTRLVEERGVKRRRGKRGKDERGGRKEDATRRSVWADGDDDSIGSVTSDSEDVFLSESPSLSSSEKEE
ncbi:hypothetical protein BLNAU_16074 [Blattamonas nauphoetae]|uniref:Transmembrane protein n=1 Tax=Blattamonas nauphoetae TaxID=2049346 RepID=A0ABQ9X8P4_9EUKA|nr:hypothetical protein BLNAU_16074 [Blattamonas nauphoetae]